MFKALFDGFEFSLALPFLIAGFVCGWLADQFGRGRAAYVRLWWTREEQ